MTDVDQGVDWTGVDIEMARQIHSQGEAYLKAQLQAAIASDQRAVTMASILAATSLAFLAATLAGWQATKDGGLLASGVAVAITLLLGAACGVWAAKPVSFWFPGNDPEHWFDCRKGDLVKAIGGEAENVSARIRWNNDILTENQQALMAGMVAAVMAPVVGAIVWAIT